MSLATRWRRLSHFWRHATVNLFLGLLIEGLITAFHHSPAVQQAENAGLDLAIKFFGTRGSGSEARPGLAFTVLDIDDPSWTAWGSPSITPRNKLVAMLRSSTKSGAAAVVVDLDLTGKEGANGLSPSVQDISLKRFLDNYSGPVPVILARLIGPSHPGDSADQLPAPVRAWFESVPDTVPRRIYWGTVQFVEEIDGVVRRWRLWEPVCDRGKPVVLPSIQLITGAVVDTGTTPAALDSWLAGKAPEDCGEPAELDSAKITVFGHELESETESLPERIIYSLSWPPEAGPVRMMVLHDGSSVPAVLRIPAAQAADTTQPIDARLMRGRIVMIGSSSAASRDWYTTPLGRMPGMMVVVNAIESLRKNGQYGTHKTALKWVVFGVLLIVASLAYAKFHPLVATLILIPLIYVAVLPISFYLFNSGVWLDFTAPVLGVQLHELIASAESAWAQRGKRFVGH